MVIRFHGDISIDFVNIEIHNLSLTSFEGGADTRPTESSSLNLLGRLCTAAALGAQVAVATRVETASASRLVGRSDIRVAARLQSGLPGRFVGGTYVSITPRSSRRRQAKVAGSRHQQLLLASAGRGGFL